MIILFKILLFIIIVNWSKGQNVVFDYGKERRASPRTRPGSPGNSNTIDNIFQIPIAVIQGTSAAAQSWSPENGDTINKVFNIPVQTLQAISTLIKDRMPQNSNNIQNKLIYQNHQYQENVTNRKRHIHQNNWTWASMWSNLFFGEHRDSGYPLHGIKKKKRKMKKGLHHGSHGILASHGNHFHGHGQHNHGHGLLSMHQRPQDVLGSDGNVYQVTEIVDDVPPPGRPFTQSDRIQNKIAPKFYD
ncbi:uncharacterized protein [Chelonus insularis]|uniref:uncharacterized protein n=1 Tax=Chelonus insularis TaxID=460826 RepID=UPI00158D2968|nr:uncharacterized protein LOC118065582 [Chelonus insularis]